MLYGKVFGSARPVENFDQINYRDGYEKAYATLWSMNTAGYPGHHWMTSTVDSEGPVSFYLVGNCYRRQHG